MKGAGQKLNISCSVVSVPETRRIFFGKGQHNPKRFTPKSPVSTLGKRGTIFVSFLCGESRVSTTTDRPKLPEKVSCNWNATADLVHGFNALIDFVKDLRGEK